MVTWEQPDSRRRSALTTQRRTCPQPGGYSATTVQELVTAVADTTNAVKCIELVGGRVYKFDASFPSFDVLDNQNVTINCNGGILVECDACGKFFHVGNHASLLMSGCTAYSHFILPPEDIKFQDPTGVLTGVAPSPNPINAVNTTLGHYANLTITDFVMWLPTEDCWVIPVTHLGSGYQNMAVGEFNDTYVEIKYLYAELQDPTSSYTSLNTVMRCNPGTGISSPSTSGDVDVTEAAPSANATQSSGGADSVSTGAVIGIVMAVLVVLAVAAAILAYIFRRRKKAAQPPLMVTNDSTSQRKLEYGIQIGEWGPSGSGPDGSLLTSLKRHNDSEPDSSASYNMTSHSGATSDMIATAIRELKDELQAEQLQIHDVIAQGGFGTVYTATWRGLKVAVKTVLFQGAQGKNSSMARAAAEASIAFNLSHRNIVNTYAHELKHIANGRGNEMASFKLYLVQELCNGDTLSKLLESGKLGSKHGGMVSRRVMTLLLGIARGMEHLHSMRIAHGDLNPNNVLLQVERKDEHTPLVMSTGWSVGVDRVLEGLDEGRCMPKITDFGLSVRMEAGARHISNVNQGTPFYTAPELTQEHRLLQASDVYSYGILMWALANNCHPFVMRDGIMERHPNFPNFKPYVPLAYAILTVDCIARDPNARPRFVDIVRALTAIDEEINAGQYVDVQHLTQKAANIEFQTHNSAYAATPSAAPAPQSDPYLAQSPSISSNNTTPAARTPGRSRNRITKSWREPSQDSIPESQPAVLTATDDTSTLPVLNPHPTVPQLTAFFSIMHSTSLDSSNKPPGPSAGASTSSHRDGRQHG